VGLAVLYFISADNDGEAGADADAIEDEVNVVPPGSAGNCQGNACLPNCVEEFHQSFNRLEMLLECTPVTGFLFSGKGGNFNIAQIEAQVSAQDLCAPCSARISNQTRWCTPMLSTMVPSISKINAAGKCISGAIIS
jgi:hypothetical protein